MLKFICSLKNIAESARSCNIIAPTPNIECGHPLFSKIVKGSTTETMRETYGLWLKVSHNYPSVRFPRLDTSESIRRNQYLDEIELKIRI